MDSIVSRRRSHSSSIQLPSSPTSSPRQTSPRQPLHERSRSQTNASPTRRNADSKVYRETLFPKLPSQVFPPASGPYIFQGKHTAYVTRPTIPPRSPHRPLTPNGSNTNLVDQNAEQMETPPVPRLPPLNIRPQSRSKESTRSESHQTFEDIFGPGVPGSRSGQNKSILRKAAPNQKPAKTPPSSSAETFAARNKLQNGKSKVKLDGPLQSRDLVEAADTGMIDTKPIQDNALQNNAPDRLRSQPSVGSGRRKAKFEVYSETRKAQQERPRSASRPETPTEAFIQTLMGSGIDLQYPIVRQPSVNSLRSTTSFSKPPYPAPLRLQRKRANSHLGRTASDANEGWSSNMRDGRLRSKTSVVSRSTVGTYDEGLPQQGTFYDPQRASGNWADEVGDVVPELDHGPGLWRSRNDHRRTSSSESRPITARSSTSGKPGSFYHFLNDSKTAWASIYYRNASQVRLEPPPHVTQLQPRCILLDEDTPEGSSSDFHSSISPGSAGFPDSLYVRRYRPHSYQHALYHTTSNSSLRPSTSLSTMRTIHHSAGPSFDGSTSGIIALADVVTYTNANVRPPTRHARIRSPEITALPPITPPHNVTAPLEPIPRLSPDRRHGARLARWTAPSLEEPDSRSEFLFGRTNRQILLFCLGFVLPFSWWIASVLALPKRPQIRAPEMRESGVEDWNGTRGDERGGRLGQAVDVDLFDPVEVRKYQKARWWRGLNRVMSLVGLAVIAAVIACAVVATR